MKLKAMFAVLGILLIAGVASTSAKEKKAKPGPLTGTWECQSHGSSQGDMPFTLSLEQTGENVTGSVESPMGGAPISSATFTKKKNLEIHIDTPNGTYLLTATVKKGKLAGEWTHDPEKGTWEGSKKAATETQ
ncbi:MAG TPA: hypothetical protein VFM21_11665 [Terriglobia bacterium]|nr:hypothetical protein [Terriglobia bacterium]